MQQSSLPTGTCDPNSIRELGLFGILRYLSLGCLLMYLFYDYYQSTTNENTTTDSSTSSFGFHLGGTSSTTTNGKTTTMTHQIYPGGGYYQETEATSSTTFTGRLLKNMELLPIAMFDRGIEYVEKTYKILDFDIKINDNKYSVTSDWVARAIDEGEYNLRDIQAAKLIKENDTILDLGSNVGITAILLAKMFPGIRIIGVEALPYNYASAIKNIRANNVQDQITILFGALSSAIDIPLLLRYSVRNPGASSASDEFYSRGSDDGWGNREFYVQPISVDEIIEFYSIKTVGFIKLDCEGCEYDIVPNLSEKAKGIFERAIVTGETHCDRMPSISSDIIRVTHDMYDFWAQEGPGGCDGRAKVWKIPGKE